MFESYEWLLSVVGQSVLAQLMCHHVSGYIRFVFMVFVACCVYAACYCVHVVIYH
jgi:hypothetical protein